MDPDGAFLADALVKSVPLLSSWGVTIDVLSAEDGHVRGLLPAQPQVCGPFGSVLGAAMLSLADLVAGAAAAFAWRARGLGASTFVTQELSFQFLASTSDDVIAAAEAIRVSDHRAVLALRVSSQEGATLAVGHTSVRRLDR